MCIVYFPIKNGVDTYVEKTKVIYIPKIECVDNEVFNMLSTGY